MKKISGLLTLTLALCLLLAGCGPKETAVVPTPAPSPSGLVTPELPTPTPEPTATPAPWEADPKDYIMGWLDKVLDGEKISLSFWLHPGSGPTPTEWPAAEYGGTVREMFENLNWEDARLLTEEEEAGETWYNEPGAYNVTLNCEDGFVLCGLNAETIRVNGKEANLYFHVGGAAELCTKLTDLESSVYVNMGRTRVPAQASQEDTLKLYLETALERTKELGHITDYALRAYAVTPPEEGAGEPQGEYPAFGYTATYTFKPARPEDFADRMDEDGWVEVNIEAYTEALLYDVQDGCYGMY